MDERIRRAGGRPSRVEAEAMTERLLDNARLRFARHGIAATSLEDIAADLGMSKHTLYRRYSNKPALLDAVVTRDLARFRLSLAQAGSENAGAVQALRAVALRYFRFGADRDYAGFYLAVLAEAAVSDPLREKLAAWSQAALQPFVAAVAAAQAAGKLPAGNAAEFCAILVDLLEGANNRVRLSAGAEPDETVRMAMFESRWRVFLAAMAV